MEEKQGNHFSMLRKGLGLKENQTRDVRKHQKESR